MLQTLDFLRRSKIDVSKKSFIWNDLDTEPAEQVLDTDLLNKLRTLPSNDLRYLVLKISEWILYIFEKNTDISLASKWIETAWIGMSKIDQVKKTWEEVRIESEWNGPIRGPINLAMRHVEWALEDAATEEGDSALSAAQMISLVKYIIDENEVFDDWLSKEIEYGKHEKIEFQNATNNPFLNI